MKDILILIVHLIVTIVRLARPGGSRNIVTETLLIKQLLQVSNRTYTLAFGIDIDKDVVRRVLAKHHHPNLGDEEIKSIPFTPTSRPFIERVIGTVRREYLDRTKIWIQIDLQRIYDSVQIYYNQYRAYTSFTWW